MGRIYVPMTLQVLQVIVPYIHIPGQGSTIHRTGLQPLFIRQVVEVQRERDLRESIPVLNPIEDDVSRAVRDQYEENPYPRWINTKLESREGSIGQVISKIKVTACKKDQPLI